MKKILTIAALTIAITASVMNVQSIASEEYIIQKGDTLWDISDSKLKDTFLWPKLWNANPEIDNPDWIYPGSKIRIPSREELMSIPPAPLKKPAKKKIRRVKREEPGHTVKTPEIRAKKYIINKERFINSGWIADKFPGIGKVTHATMGRHIAGEGDTVYLEISDSGISSSTALIVSNIKTSTGDKYFSIKDVKVVKHPETGNVLGHQVRITGILQTTGSESGLIKAMVTTSFEDTEVGSAIIPYHDMEPPLIRKNPRRPDLNGYIISSHSTGRISGIGDIIFLDKGKEDGLMVGDVFDAITELPVDTSIGLLQVIALQPTTSSAVVLESNQEVAVGYRWGQK